jgi:hypothetical protein
LVSQESLIEELEIKGQEIACLNEKLSTTSHSTQPLILPHSSTSAEATSTFSSAFSSCSMLANSFILPKPFLDTNHNIPSFLDIKNTFTNLETHLSTSPKSPTQATLSPQAQSSAACSLACSTPTASPTQSQLSAMSRSKCSSASGLFTPAKPPHQFLVQTACSPPCAAPSPPTPRTPPPMSLCQLTISFKHFLSDYKNKDYGPQVI